MRCCPPLFVATQYLGAGNMIAGSAFAAVAAISAYLFAMACKFSVAWLKLEREKGGFDRG
ncbi:MAG: hypothetical protein ABS40_06755 [Agrobacterium sp. SCN 61-19]|nr:MAG: hypothetical protein ABS40_06755 [Agrobacterium sp. SCN 61-19]